MAIAYREKRREGHAPPREPAAHVGQGEKIVTGEHRVVDDGENDREAEAQRRRGENIGSQLVPADAAQLGAQDAERRQKQHEPGDRRQDLDNLPAREWPQGVAECPIQSIASTRRRSNSARLSLNR